MTGDPQTATEAPSRPAADRDSWTAVVDLYKRDVDRTLLRAQLAKTPEERFRDVMRMQVAVEEFRRAGRAARHSP